MKIIEEKVNLIIEYIEQILSDNLKIKGTMSINSEEINGVKYKTLNISVPQRNFERHFNLGISYQDEVAFFKCLLNTLTEKYLKSDNIGISKYYNILSLVGSNFQGIGITSVNGNYLRLCFPPSSKEVFSLIENYDKEIDDYIKEQGHVLDNVGIPEINLDKLNDRKK